MRNKGINILLLFTLLHSCSPNSDLVITLDSNEQAWAGVVRDGHLMPFSDGYAFDFYGDNKGNQLQPLILTSNGKFAWSEYPFSFEVQEGVIKIRDSYNSVVISRYGNSLSEAYSYVSEKYFTPSGKLPDTLLFTAPQYNTWIELNFNHNQEDILKYARSVIDNGLPPGVFMIDDTWQEDYGIWDFHPGRFPDPKAMVEELHLMGFKVMLWIIPFISPDQRMVYTYLSENNALMQENLVQNAERKSSSKPAMVRWWNGVSAMLDLTNDTAVEWFTTQLEYLTSEYGIDGFKFDGGDTYFFTPDLKGNEDIIPNEHTRLFAKFGLDYPLNEYRACWKMGGQPIAQRLHDKNHDWSDLRKLVPQMLVMGISGYPFACPDMIGGGEIKTFLDKRNIDQELIVRSAQCHALMPMMQFSVAPWRVLDKTHMNALKEAVDLRMKFTPLIMDLAQDAARTGEPIVRSLSYVFPGQGLEFVTDQFMLGDSLLVAPVLKPAEEKREVILPEGFWLSDEGEYLQGGKKYFTTTPLNRLPYFKRLENKQTKPRSISMNTHGEVISEHNIL